MPSRTDHQDINSLEMMLFGGVVELPEPIVRSEAYGAVETRFTGRPSRACNPKTGQPDGEVIGVVVVNPIDNKDIDIAPPDYYEKFRKGKWSFGTPCGSSEE